MSNYPFKKMLEEKFWDQIILKEKDLVKDTNEVFSTKPALK